MASYDNSEDYPQNEQSTKENAEEYFEDEDSDESVEMIADPADVPIPKGLLVTLILIIYAGLMMATGVIVYSTYGNYQAGTSLDGFTSTNVAPITAEAALYTSSLAYQVILLGTGSI
ncbi:uncharacterized protein LOC123470122 isoform X2 [Daphnia magna]|uniref:Uncharacterized protein n=2 Tax=Daphnia magna TaxID=35525 RepID=A0ABR0A7B5_9CRUS|nr:uncharacterized protein LOC123470122 isoform X2 [Daphnia magna]KAK4021034.1 hypothetical protein OUZ56_002969 [Daphnia magna]